MDKFSKNQLERYPLYLKYFKELEESGIETISSPKIADRFGYSQEQVRKDLQAISDSPGKPKCGRSVQQLIVDLETFLGYRNVASAIVIGTGHLGEALLNFPAFSDMGLEIVAGMDSDPSKVGTTVGGKKIYDIKNLKDVVDSLSIQLAIITVPAEVAQKVVDIAIESGIRGIWNFAPVSLIVPPHIAIENVNLASSLAVLAHKLGKATTADID